MHTDCKNCYEIPAMDEFVLIGVGTLEGHDSCCMQEHD
jgi:hypothetical protein